MLRTLHLDTQISWRGGQSQALLLMRGLIERGHIAELMTPRGSPLSLRARHAGITVHDVSPKFPRVHGAWTLWRILRNRRANPGVNRPPNGEPNDPEIGPANHNFDIVHAHDSHALAAAWLAGVHRQGTLVASRRVAYQLSKGRLALARYRAASSIIAVSRFVARSMEDRGIEPPRIAIVYDGVTVPPQVTADQHERVRSAARARWGIAEGDCAVGCVSHLSPEKGQEVLLRALHLLAARDFATEFVPECAPKVPVTAAEIPGSHAGPRGVRLLLAGAGNDRARLESLAKDLGIADRVIFAGFVDDVGSIYAALDIFLFPSGAEPLGSSLLDAMACGLPCIAVASGGVPEVLEDGVNGVLVPAPASPADFADAVSPLNANPTDAARLGAAARDSIAARFSAAHMVGSTLAIYEEVLGRR
jgi:glycosyltransferase involved in cell wall biosynthesis